MDAQNAVESTTTRPAAPDRRPLDLKKTSLDLPSSPPIKLPSALSQAPDDDGSSDAETVVLPGKDGYSPSKTRKMVNRVDLVPTDTIAPAGNNGRNGDHHPHQKERYREKDRGRDRGRDADKTPRPRPGAVSAEAASSLVAKKKKSLHDRNGASLKDGSSGLSSAPASPPQLSHHRLVAEHRSRGNSDSEPTRPGSPKLDPKVRDRSREKVRAGEKVVPHKKKASAKPDGDDEGEPRKICRPRLSGNTDPSSAMSGKQLPRDPKLSLGRQQYLDSKTPTSRTSHSHPFAPSRHRSTSPARQPPLHSRSLSTQLPSSTGPALKKRRIPPPLTTDYHSDDSSGSGSPYANLRTLTTPATADSVVSPAKMPPHKKHLDAHGQTLLARACAKGEHDTAKARLMERPGDLNVADYAGNTPLQIASLQGHAEIVKLLLDSGCALDCMNNDRDTPLLDAVDNGHLEVVRLLLDAGVNPRKTNINGEEPFARVTEDMDNAEEIRTALQEARNRPNAAWRRPSEEQHGYDQIPQEPNPPERPYREGRSHGPESPRRSPVALSHTALGRRAATSRATKTSNSQLYKPLDDKTLRDAALRGDEETVLRILQVKDGFNDPESMVGAARGGHETVMQYLLALGGCDPDPDPVPSLPKDANTPMLAAIGQGTLGIVKLLLDQSNFDPRRKLGGQTYYEVARDRAGPDWQQEEDILKKAYDECKKSARGSHKDKSPNRRLLTKEQRAARAEGKGEAARAHKRKASSPTRDRGKPKVLSSKASSALKEKRRAPSFSGSDDQASKRGPGRPWKDTPSVGVPTRDESIRAWQKTPAPKPKRQDTDHGANSSDGEADATKPRRKLVSGRQLKDEREREKQRRSSMVSNNSAKEMSSPRERDDGLEKVKVEPPSEKYHDRAKAIRRDDSNDRLSATGEGSTKRPRSSITPPRHQSGDREDGEVPLKRRRLDMEGKEKRRRSTHSSPEDRHGKPPTLKESSSAGTKSTAKDPEKAARREAARAAKLASKSHISTEKLSNPKSTDLDMTNSPVIKTENDSDSQSRRDMERRRRVKLEALEARKRREEEDRIREEEATKQREEEEQKRHEAEEARKQEAARRQQEEEERKRKEAEERQRQEEKETEDRIRREEEERLRLAEEERKRSEEEERRRKQEEERLKREEERQRREKEERQRREQEEARKEQLLREAAAAQRREAEARARRIREEQERLRLAQEAEQRRIEAEQRRIREEQERLRISRLPPLLQWFDACDEPRTREVASKFTTMQGVRYDTIVPRDANCTVRDETRRELWVLNTHVAFLLGDKDLSLSRFPGWQRHAANHIAKSELMGVEGGTYALTAPSVRSLVQELPGYVETINGSRGLKMAKDRGDAHKLFVAMDLFFVRVSDFLSAVTTTPHLRNLEIAVQYRELPLSEDMRSRRQLPLLWKNDSFWANRNHGSAPGAMLYENGMVVGETTTGRLVKTSTTPFPDGPVPRRGFTSVRPDDPEYERLCREQGLEHLLNHDRLPNGPRRNVTCSPMSPRHLHTLTPVTPGTTEPTEADLMPSTNMYNSMPVAGRDQPPFPNGIPEPRN